MQSLSTLAAILLFSVTASAKVNYNCKTETKPLQTTYEISSQGDSFVVKFYGSSRNTYAAVYTAVGWLPTRTGGDIFLEKSQDFSTWKDMPQKLNIQDSLAYKPMHKLVLKGLGKDIVFTGEECASGE